MQNGIQSAFIFYPSRRLGISSRVSVYIITEGVFSATWCKERSDGLARNERLYNTWCWWYAISCEIDDIQGSVLILVRLCDIIASKRWYYAKKLSFSDINPSLSLYNLIPSFYTFDSSLDPFFLYLCAKNIRHIQSQYSSMVYRYLIHNLFRYAH